MLLLPSTLTLREARDTQRMLAQGLQAEPDGAVVINASGLQQFDTSALAVLLECDRLAKAFGRSFEVRDQIVSLKPMRSSPEDKEVVVKTEVKGKGDPIQLDYRLEKAGDSWKIYDVNVLGVWLVENYKNSFAQEISSGGIDGLIAKMAERNKAAAAGGKS